VKLVKSLKADEDLIDIYLYGFFKFGEQQAEKYFAELEAAFDLISNNPYMANESIVFKQSFRIHPHGSHKIIYCIESVQVLVVRILHESMIPELHL
jgi:toxin ParE1/3/4